MIGRNRRCGRSGLGIGSLGIDGFGVHRLHFGGFRVGLRRGGRLGVVAPDVLLVGGGSCGSFARGLGRSRRRDLGGLQLLELLLEVGDFRILERDQAFVLGLEILEVLDARLEFARGLIARGERFLGACEFARAGRCPCP